jgi:hypothetical protein
MGGTVGGPVSQALPRRLTVGLVRVTCRGAIIRKVRRAVPVRVTERVGHADRLANLDHGGWNNLD